MIEHTRVFKLLRGYRNRPVDLDGIVSLVKLSQLVTDLNEVAEVDINPLLASPAGVVALDARIALVERPRGIARLAIRPYPAELDQDILLEDGTPMRLRPIRPEDEPALQRAFDRLSPETIRMRFFSSMNRLAHATAAHLTQIDYDRDMAFILVEPRAAGSTEIHGVVRLSADPNGERAEFACRGFQAGIAMQRIIDYAASRESVRDLAMYRRTATCRSLPASGFQVRDRFRGGAAREPRSPQPSVANIEIRPCRMRRKHPEGANEEQGQSLSLALANGLPYRGWVPTHAGSRLADQLALPRPRRPLGLDARGCAVHGDRTSASPLPPRQITDEHTERRRRRERRRYEEPSAERREREQDGAGHHGKGGGGEIRVGPALQGAAARADHEDDQHLGCQRFDEPASLE